MKENKLNEEGRMLFENNPLMMVCSIVCNHEKQCEGKDKIGAGNAAMGVARTAIRKGSQDVTFFLLRKK